MNEENIDELIHLFESVDRWETRCIEDPLTGFHIKIKDYNTETKIVTFSWYDGKDGLEDDLSFDEFKKRFEPWYDKSMGNELYYYNQYSDIWNDFDSEVYRDDEEKDLIKLIVKVKKLF